ncbi:MAG: hypothetical protein ACAH59_01420 [Pseudobdellovibrionaceae bacterium]
MRILKKSKWFLLAFVGLAAAFLVWKRAYGPQRQPAQFASEMPQAQFKEFKRHVIQTLKIEKISDSQSDISLRLPLEICQSYQKFRLLLEAEGFALNGKPVQVSLEKTCLDLDPQSFEIHWHFSQNQQSELLDEPVKTWVLKGLQFVDSDGSVQQRITGYEFISVWTSPPEIHFGDPRKN